MLQYTFSGLKTKRVVFEDVFNGLDSATLEQLKDLSAKRRLIEEAINDTSLLTEATAREMSGGLTSRSQQDLQRLEQYLPLLQNFIVKVDSIASHRVNSWITNLRIRWASSLGPSTFSLNGPKFFQINSLKYELGMTLFAYALTLRKQAFEVLTDSQLSASLLTKSSGVFNYLNTEVLPSFETMLPREKPPEITTNLCRAMSLICLAEAQVVVIMMAEKKGMSKSLLSKLHFGVTQFLDEASALLQSSSRDISRKFLEFIYSSRTLHDLRSHRHLADSYKESEQLGIAMGLLKRALENKPNMPGEKSWDKVLKNEIKHVSELLNKYHKENVFVWGDKVPLGFKLPSLEGKNVVSASLYEPPIWERELAFKI